MSANFYEAIEKRRSVYGISAKSDISDARIQQVIAHAVKHTPSAFNSQSARVVLLLGQEHDKLWGIVEAALKAIVPEESFAGTKEKIDSFRSGYGSVLYFEDYDVVEGLQAQFPPYKDNFPIWSHQSSGMLQYNVWTSFAIEGLGASLQHYGELIEAQVKAEWNLPKSWKLIAQMPFGKPVADAGPKEFSPIENRLLVFSK